MAKADVVKVAHFDEPREIPVADGNGVPPAPGAVDGADVPLDAALEPVPAAGMTLDELETLALANNPAVQQISAMAHRAMGLRTQVGLKPNPTLGYFAEEIGSEGGSGLQGAFASQTFVRGDKLELNRRVLDGDVQQILWEIEAQRYRVRTDVRQFFYAALAAQQRLELAREFQEIARKGVRIAEERLEALEGARPDVLQAEVQVAEVELIAEQAQLALQAAWESLAAVAGVPDMSRPLLAGSLQQAWDDVALERRYAELVSRSPQLQAAYVRVQRARANLARQEAEPIPNLLAQVGAGHDDGPDDAFANLQLAVPLPVHNQNEGNIRAAYAEYCAATQNVRRLELRLRGLLVQAHRDYETARIRVERYEERILPRTAEALALSDELLTLGEFDFLRVLVVRRGFFDANLEYVQALSDLAQADALIDGLLLTGGLIDPPDFDVTDELRGQALSGQ